ncbi:hypothetical protein JOL79_11330 [Microbispora sp. RL4-1S]|uniref:Uncharacterized protein n=1 Tax=Microbispora oryzae TaxID=2806554 RepID=A0A940WF57_9ACTN|nr:hypothetical protein [Microbispora oryzae]MBP2704405.1 hypothetical protein [Microbispora oryzae]
MALPRPITGAEEYLAAVHERLGETNELLRALIDRAPAQPDQQADNGVVELREPAESAAPGPGFPAAAPASGNDQAAPTSAAKRPARRSGGQGRSRTSTKNTET